MHFLGTMTKWKNRKWNAFLICSFSLYTVFLIDCFERYLLLAVLAMGGLFEQTREWLDSRSRWKKYASPIFPVLIFVLSSVVVKVPNVLLMGPASASISAEYARFFFRPRVPGDEVRSDGVVIWQDPPPRRFPLNLRFGFAWAHSVFSFLPFPVWPTLTYELGEPPSITITHLRAGHGPSDLLLVPIEDGQVNTVTQFHRIYGSFKGLPEENDQLHLRVLVKPMKRVLPLVDKLTDRWWVQPRDATWNDVAELKLTYQDADSGKWYCDAFFGAPQNRGDPFEILAIVTSDNLKRGQLVKDETLRSQWSVSDHLTVWRER